MRLAWMKKLASLLLLVCFVLPLSRCEPKKAPPGAPQAEVVYLYAYDMVGGAVEDIGKGRWRALPDLGALFIVFFVPAFSLLLKASWQPPLLFCSAFPALYALVDWMTLFHTPQIGAILAIECWTLLLLLSALALLERWRSRRP